MKVNKEKVLVSFNPRSGNRQEWIDLLCGWDNDQESGPEWNNINAARF